MDPSKIKYDDFVGKVHDSSKEITPKVIISGFVGKSPNEGMVRIYDDISLNDYLEVSYDDVVHQEPLQNSDLGGSMLWLNPTAKISQGNGNYHYDAAKNYFKGDIMNDAGNQYFDNDFNGNNRPTTSYTCTDPYVTSRACPWPTTSRNCPWPTTSRTCPPPITSYGCPEGVTTITSHGCPAPITSRTCPAPITSRTCPAPITSRTCPGPTTSRTCPAPITSRTCPSPITSRTCPGPTTSRTCPGPITSWNCPDPTYGGGTWYNTGDYNPYM